MTMIRGSSLWGYRHLVSELGGDPDGLLHAAGVPLASAGDYDVFVAYGGYVRAIESAAATTRTADFGRRLAGRQSIDILGPVGVAARTAPTVRHAFTIVQRFLSSYGPAIGIGLEPSSETTSFFESRILAGSLPPHPQTLEKTMGVAIQVFRMLWGPGYCPLRVHLPHEPLSPVRDYQSFYGCTPSFSKPKAGFTLRTSDLERPVSTDRMAHESMVRYLESLVAPPGQSVTDSVRELVRPLLPAGSACLSLIADQLNLHPKTLQRRLAAEGTTFAEIVDGVRRESAERYLRDTELTLTHLSRVLGYAEASVLSRACQRWFGQGASAQRIELRRHEPVTP